MNTPPRPSLLRRIGILSITAATTALAVAAVAVGSSAIATRAESARSTVQTPPVPVRTVDLSLTESYSVDRAFIGQIEARESTDLAFELGGTVQQILVEEGDTVAAGDIIARLDTRTLVTDRQAQVAARRALRAQAELARLTTQRRQRLVEGGAVPTQTYDDARFSQAEIEARIAQTSAVIAGIDVRLDKSVIRAPFDARVAQRMGDTGVTVASGTPIVRLLASAAPEMRLGLPPALARDMAPGTPVRLALGDRQTVGTVTSLLPDLDPVTRTQAVMVALPDTGTLPYGETVAALLPQTIAATGAWVPVAALQEGRQGLWTVLTETDGTVGQEAVEILYADENRAYVRGTFDGPITVIVAGPHRVIPGQTVAALED